MTIREGRSFWTVVWNNRPAAASLLFIAGLTVVALVAPLISPESYGSFDYRQGGLHPQIGWRYLLGTDVYGHSLVMYLILGARTTLGIGVLATALALSIGSVLGVVAGYCGGWIERLLMWVVDVILVIPFFPLLIVLVAYLGPTGPFPIVLTFGLAGAPSVGRSMREWTMPFRRERAEPSRAAGTSSIRMLGQQMVRNLMRPAVLCSMWLLTAFLTASVTIDFLGLGLPTSTPSWGTALRTAPDYLNGGYWWWILFPGLALFLALLSINTVGRTVVDMLGERDSAQFE